MKFWQPLLLAETSFYVSCVCQLFLFSGGSRYAMAGGHTNTERGYLPVLASKLQQEFAKVEPGEPRLMDQLVIHISKADKHPLDIV